MHDVRSISDLLSQIGRGEILLPEFQRGYVWKRGQVRGLVQSLYRKHPTGHLLVWRTYKPSKVRLVEARNGDSGSDGHSLLLLDGQQRLTTLYALFTGDAPPFYEGERLFFDLYFNVQTEEFRFWQKTRMQNNPAWIGVHDFLRETLQGLLQRLPKLETEHRDVLQQNLARLGRLDQIRSYTYTVDRVSGDEFGVDEVVEIFNRINSKGTPLKKADLALAHVCSIWPEAREEMRTFQATMAERGFKMDFDFFLRCLAGVAKGSIRLEGTFLKIPATELQQAWNRMRPAFEHLVAVLRHDAFIGDDGDLPTASVLVPATVFLAREGGQFPSDSVKQRFIRWIYLAGLWARYSGATETKLQQDVALVAGSDPDPTHELEEAILRERGRIALEASDLAEVRISSSAAAMARITARARGARDWFVGLRIYDKARGTSNGSERHYVFSLPVLKKAGLDSAADRKIINELANRAFLARKAPREVRSSPPSEYLAKVDDDQPGALRAQSIPLDRELWNPERYRDFLSVRRQLLAQAINEYIETWRPDDEDGFATEEFVRRMMEEGESQTVEFKSSLRWDRVRERTNTNLERDVIKTVAGFLNSETGGTLLIGVDDAGKPAGIDVDYKTLRRGDRGDRDGFQLHLQQIIARDLGRLVATHLTVTFHVIDGHDICQVTTEAGDRPVYAKAGNSDIFYLRAGPATQPLSVKETVTYVGRRWGGAA
ncbi:GmrSD restriction endonuclease domain-containing protein [Candidatus Palauibacter sp.]|uniref:GmrSD restriction endonuclease domain-containing protein n=1 Tax=Candidatus Palauibacter sp. TaxID=3101350 RepID=UPI003B5A47D2